jgi:hypothetical protein
MSTPLNSGDTSHTRDVNPLNSGDTSHTEDVNPSFFYQMTAFPLTLAIFAQKLINFMDSMTTFLCAYFFVAVT